MQPLLKGHYIARVAAGAADLAAAQGLRHLCFRAGPGLDADAFDAACTHLLVEDTRDGALVCCCRVLPLGSGQGIGSSYAAQFYDLTALAAFDRPMLELGRFCIRPDRPDPDILRIAWAALARMVDASGAAMLFGCTSFRGTDAAPYRDAFAALCAQHLAPSAWAPRIRAPQVHLFALQPPAPPDPRRAAQAMPPLLRSYLAMGGWVSDHAVVDAGMNTLHVFTALDIAAIPPARARALRMLGA